MKIKDARTIKKLSQEATARLVDISLKHYQDIEKGVSIPSVTIAIALCEVFQVDIKDIVEWGEWKERLTRTNFYN